jgi:hypothetical protein
MENILNYHGIEINQEEIKNFTKERYFTHLAFELAKETGIYISEIARFTPREEGLTRDEAILSAHLVRLSKFFFNSSGTILK